MKGYSSLKQEAKKLYEQARKKLISRHPISRRTNIASIYKIADKKLPTVIGGIKSVKEQLGVKSNYN